MTNSFKTYRGYQELQTDSALILIAYGMPLAAILKSNSTEILIWRAIDEGTPAFRYINGFMKRNNIGEIADASTEYLHELVVNSGYGKCINNFSTPLA